MEGLVYKNKPGDITLASMGEITETLPFVIWSAHGQVVAWCKYSSSETDSRIAIASSMLSACM